jgi:hypothetical protein
MNIGHPKNSASGMQAKGTPCVKCENKHGAYNGGKVKSFSSGRIKLFGGFGFWGMGVAMMEGLLNRLLAPPGYIVPTDAEPKYS